MAEDTKGYETYGEEQGISKAKAKEYWESASASVKKETGKTKDELSESDWKHVFGVFKSIITNSKKKETIDIVTTRKYIIEGNSIDIDTKILLEVDVKVKNEGVLEIPEGKEFKDMPLSHFISLAKKIGKKEVSAAINNLARFNENKNPSLASKAKSVMDSLKDNKEWQDIEAKKE